jgi:hypothetical protein
MSTPIPKANIARGKMSSEGTLPIGLPSILNTQTNAIPAYAAFLSTPPSIYGFNNFATMA